MGREGRDRVHGGGGLGRAAEREGDRWAHQMLRSAYEAGYRFDPGFPGFRADLYYTDDAGNEVGCVEAVSPGEVAVECDLREAGEWVRWELASLLWHRWPLPYGEAEGRHRLALDRREHPLGTLIEVRDGSGTAYRVLGGQVSYIRRNHGGLRLEITLHHRETVRDGRTLPVQFAISYWDAGLDLLLRTDSYTDEYAPVGGLYLPVFRRVVSAAREGLSVRQLMLKDHELLGAGPVAR